MHTSIIPQQPQNRRSLPGNTFIHVAGRHEHIGPQYQPVFANIKNNHGFKRFMLRGKQKVTIETGLLALAHNLRKEAFHNIKKAAYKSCRSLILKYPRYYSLLKN